MVGRLVSGIYYYTHITSGRSGAAVSPLEEGIHLEHREVMSLECICIV
jgi:hypothetical protein